MKQFQYKPAGSPNRDFVQILGVKVWNTGYGSLREWLIKSSRNHDRLTLLAIANAHTMNLIQSQPVYREGMRMMDRIINDGVGMNIAARMRKTYFVENLNGSDLIPRLLKDQQEPLCIFLYGADEISSARTAFALEGISEHIRVVGRLNGFDTDETEVVEAVNAARPDLLLVALGQPAQEDFLCRNRDKLKAGVAVGVGALFDFLSGGIRRAPQTVQSLKLEWCYRLFREPRRMFWRYVIGNPRFLWNAWRWAARERAPRKETSSR